MAIQLPTDEPRPQGNRRTLITCGVVIMLPVTCLTALIMLPREKVAEWLANGEAWLSGFKESYTPTEELLLASSVFSLFVSVLVEVIVFSMRQHRSKQTQRWLRYVLFITLIANALLALTAILSTFISDSMLSNGVPPENIDCTGLPEGMNPNTYYGQGNMRRPPSVTRWFGLLIALFSVILLVSAWMDFQEQDRWQQEFGFLSKEEADEKLSPLFISYPNGSARGVLPEQPNVYEPKFLSCC
ncbi:hypothetical protein F4779DRAFT_601413 [Xylariaceae sp. FL0662B]|nr:hypothetical protein F4779DRAFT_601413 [Xylariaceae sp. FL0662B]